MKVEIKIPAVGESITEATIGQWLKKNGEFVKRNEPVLSLETDKASVEVASDADGVLEIKAKEGETVQIGSVAAYVDSDAKPTASSEPAAAKPQAAAPAPSMSASAAAPASNGSKASAELREVLSPAVQKIVNEKGLNPSQIEGTGRGGRLTKEDVMNATPTSAPAASRGTPEIAPPPPSRPSGKQGDIKRVTMTTLRRRIAERLVESQHTAAILTTFNEIDMTNVMAIRSRYKDRYKEKYNVGLGFMGFFVKACIEGLKEIPGINASIEGNDVLYKNFYNIGVAVGTEKGLIVPVIKDADQLSIAEIELSIKHFATKARDGKITIDDLSGGTFTISNGGVYGSLMSTPIINPPQSGILGMHKIEERAVVIDKKVEVRPMMYVALSYDHRLVDGKEAVTFLVRVKDCVENPERILLEI